MSTIPSRPPQSHSTARDLSDAEFAELDDLLVATPEPLEPCDVVMLDGFLCGVIAQPVLLEVDAWLPHVFDFDGREIPEGSVTPEWRERTRELILRRHAALMHALADDGYFHPLILELDEDAPAPGSQEDGTLDESLAARLDAFGSLSPISQPLMPWVAGFQHATQVFPALVEFDNDAVMLALARLYRHLPVEGEDERELVATMEREHPLSSLDDAIEELVATVADLFELTSEARYKVDTVRHEQPKPGRNDLCHCGSGKKFKHCHGA